MMMNEEEEVMMMVEYLYECELKQKEIAKKWHDLATKLISENKNNK